MYGSICGIVLIGFVLSGSMNFGSCQSPCPDYFSYLTDEITGEVTGRIAIPNAPKDVALHLRISLSVPTTLPTKYVGTLELESSKSESVKAVRAGRPLIYRLHFPLRNPIPLLTEITFNKQRYCTGPRAAGQVVTTIFLEHTLFPPGVMALSDDPSPTNSDTKPDWNSVRPAFPTVEKRPTVVEPVRRPRPEVRPSVSFQPPTRRPQPEVRPSVPFQPPIRRPQPEVPFVLKHPSESTIAKPSSDKNSENCGRANPGGVNYLIANGERTSPGQWPWLAAIFVTKIEYEFCCGGSLITDKHIVTAAHCKYQNGMYLPASAFLVSLGRYHLLHWRERGSKNHEVLKFMIHPDYHDRGSADADLALITLRERVEFTPRIRPLCLWYGSNDLQSVVGRFGYVVGWGRDEHGERVLEPRMAQMPIVSQEDCLRSHKSFKKATSNRTLCAGLRDGSGPCNGDSGGGLVIRDVSTDRYYLRGVVSLSLTSTSMGCDLSSYTIYADTAMYMDWIRTNTISPSIARSNARRSQRTIIRRSGDREMWVHRVLSSILFLYGIVALGEEYSSSLRPEEIIVLKLKTAAQLRENLGKVLFHLPVRDYEMYNSIKLIRKYLRNGGSLVNSLEVLPSIAYLPIRDQLNEILRSMENYLPRYVLPAIGVIRGAINGGRRPIDVEDVFRPNYGPLKADLLYKIRAVDLPIVAEETSLSSGASGERRELVDEALAILSSGNIKNVGPLIAQILNNIKLNNDNPEVRESVRHLVRVLGESGKKLNNLTVTDDAYDTVKGAVIAIGGRREDNLAWESSQTLLPYLKKPEEFCTSNKKIEGFFVGEVFNHSLLLSQGAGSKLSEAGAILSRMIERGDMNVDRAFEGFHSIEYVDPIDLLIASISHLRRYQSSQGASVEALEEVYATLMKKYRSDHWSKDRPSNAGRMKTVLRGMIHGNGSPRIRRLVDDIVATIGNGLAPGALRKAMAFVSSSECHGPSCTAMKVLRALNDFRGLNDLSLRASVTELLTTWREETEEEIDNCDRSLGEEIGTEEVESLRDVQNVTINATDLLQAVQGLVPESPSYILLREFLEDRNELEKQLGEVIDLRAHPTRGRLLAWLLQKLAASENLEESIRKLAEDLVDRVSQDGYGAAAVEESPRRLWIGA